jgi:hypothetical protein
MSDYTVFHELEAHEDTVLDLAFSPDGHRCARACWCLTAGISLTAVLVRLLWRLASALAGVLAIALARPFAHSTVAQLHSCTVAQLHSCTVAYQLVWVVPCGL